MPGLAPHQIAGLRKKQAAAAKAHLGMPAHEIVRLNREERQRNEAKAVLAAGAIVAGGAAAGLGAAVEGAAAGAVAAAAAGAAAEVAVGKVAGAIHPALGVAHAGFTAESGLVSAGGVRAMGHEIATSAAEDAMLGGRRRKR